MVKMKQKITRPQTEVEKEAHFAMAEKYWKHYDRYGSGPYAIKTRMKMYPEGDIPMRPKPKKLRDSFIGCTSFLNPDNYKKAVELDKLLKKKLARASRKKTATRATS